MCTKINELKKKGEDEMIHHPSRREGPPQLYSRARAHFFWNQANLNMPLDRAYAKSRLNFQS